MSTFCSCGPMAIRSNVPSIDTSLASMTTNFTHYFVDAAKLLADNPGAQINAVLQDPQGMKTDQLHPDNKWRLVLVTLPSS